MQESEAAGEVAAPPAHRTAEERLERLLGFQRVLAQVARRIGPALEVQPVLDVALDAMGVLLPAGAVAVCLVEDGELVVAASDPPGREAAGPLAARAVATGRPASAAALAVPLTCLGQVVGALEVEPAGAAPFDQDDLWALEGLATVVAGAVESARRYEAISRLERLKADFIARVSHELRTPITIMGGFASTLRRHWPVLGGAERDEMLERIQAANARLAALVDELLTVASFEAGMEEARPVDLRLAPVLDEVRAEAADPGAVAVACDPEVRVVADPRLLRHALALLVDNALKYAGDAELRVVRWLDPPATVVEVRDHGPGIPDDLRPHVFERFTRGEHAQPGMGLGLALVRSLATALGGRVEVDAPPGGGSVFRLVLPS